MISNNTSSRWLNSQHCRIRRTSACRSRLTIPSTKFYWINCYSVQLRKLQFTSPLTCGFSWKRCLNIDFPLCFRMVNILLPAYSRHYSSLRAAGLVTAADEKENHELEHLVLRERGVVWADQEGVGKQLKGEGIGEESQETNEAASFGLRSELAPVLSFSHLLYHQSSPCSKSSYSYHPLYSSVVVYLAYI